MHAVLEFDIETLPKNQVLLEGLKCEIKKIVISILISHLVVLLLRGLRGHQRDDRGTVLRAVLLLTYLTL